jgi:hypothetical protein
MKIYELKEKIAEVNVDIKALKKELRQPHDEVQNSSSKMYKLYDLKCKVRAMYLIYGWFRGKRLDQIEKYPLENYYVTYHVKKLLADDDKFKLFNEWIKSTHLANLVKV